MRGEKVTPKRNLTVAQAAAITDGSIPSSEIEKEVKQITIARNRTYNVYLFTHKGKKYWHPYGNAMTYKPSRKDITTLCEKVEEQFWENIFISTLSSTRKFCKPTLFKIETMFTRVI